MMGVKNLITSRGLYLVTCCLQLAAAYVIKRDNVVLPSNDLVMSELQKDSGGCCAALSRFIPDKVFSPASPSYLASVGSYWAVQESEIQPACVVKPTETSDISTAVFILNLGNRLELADCKFAIRSGGHTPNPGYANIAAGVTIDLQGLNEVTVAEDQKSVTIGPGNRWRNVYSQLEPLGIMTIGGRVSPVGAGGLITGGGISFFSFRYGLVCDNVINMEVVLASGEVVNASAQSNPDLFRALKGGSSNFGVVTSITLPTFEQGLFWGGLIFNPATERTNIFNYLANFTTTDSPDPDAALITSLDWVAGAWIMANNIEYAKPVINPPVFQPLTSIPQLLVPPPTMRIAPITDLGDELSIVSPSGRRQLFTTMTIAADVATMEEFYQLSDATTTQLALILGFSFSIAYQPFPRRFWADAAARGGNSLGLEETDEGGDMINVLVLATWTLPTDDETVNTAIQALFTAARKAAADRGTARDYIYLNYAAPWQDVIASYGAQSVATLKRTSKKYDPTGLFQTGVPGGHKL